jgi:hypothetical protein
MNMTSAAEASTHAVSPELISAATIRTSNTPQIGAGGSLTGR